MAMTTFLPQPGSMFKDRFMIRELVGLGPIAGVYRATDMALQKDVILKVFYPGLAGPKVRDVNLFRIFRARAFLHKNILTVQEVFSGDDCLYVTKDIVESVSLRTLQSLKREALEPFAKKEIANLVFEMCEALKMIHLLGANGNLKPENILLSANGLRIDDPFFLVGRSDVPPDHGSFPFADRYLAPEQLQDEMQERKESDIYALALIMGEVLVGKPVKPEVPLSDQGPFFSPELDELYVRATASDPGARFGSVSLFWETVRQVFRLAAEEFGPGRTPSAFLPAGYQTRAKASPPPTEAFPYSPTQTTVFQAVRMPPTMPPVSAPHPAQDDVVLLEPQPAVTVRERPVELPVVEDLPSATPASTVDQPVGEAPLAPVDEVLLEDAPVSSDEEAELMAELEREAAVEAARSLQPELVPAALIPLEPEVDVAERVAPGPDSHLALEVESALPPEVPVSADAPRADAAVLLEIERIIEESRELDSVLMPPEAALPSVPAITELEIETPEEPAMEAAVSQESAGVEAVGSPEVAETSAEEIEVDEFADGEELEGEFLEAEAEASEVDSEMADDLAAFDEDDEVVLTTVGRGGAAQFAAPPPPAPRPPCLAPEKGYRRDQEFWRLRHVEEDSDLEELIGAAGAKRDEDEDLLVLGERAAPKKAEVGETAVQVDLSAPVKAAEAPKKDKHGKKDKKKKGDKADAVVVLGAAPVEAAPVPTPGQTAPVSPKQAVAKPVVSQGSVVAPAGKSGSKWGWIVAAIAIIAVLAGVTGLIVTQMGKGDDKEQKKTSASLDDGKAKKAVAEAEQKKAKEIEAKKKADEEAKAKKAADDKKKAEAKKAGDLKKAEEEKQAAQRKAEEAKIAAETAKAAAELAAAKEAGAKALTPVLESAAVAQTRLEKVKVAVGELQAELQPLLALDDKAREKQKAVIDALNDLVARGAALAPAYEAALKELTAVRESVANAATIQAAALPADRLDSLRKGQASASLESGRWLLVWYERSLERKLALLTQEAGKLPAKQKELASAKAEGSVATVSALADALGGRLPAMVTEKKVNAPDEAAVESELTRVEALDREITDFSSRVAAALALTAEAPVAVVQPDQGGQPANNTVEMTPEAKKTAELAALDKVVSAQAYQMKKLMDALRKKGDEWKKGANVAKEKENLDLASELDKALKALSDVSKLVKAEDLDNAKAAFDVLKGANLALMAQATKLTAEKVVAAGGTDPESQGTQPAGGGDDKEALKNKTCPGGMKLMVVKNSDKASAAKFVAYCIDFYEFPGAGSMPKVNVSWDGANAACVAQGKRLCKKAEWQAACGGKYPYGSEYNPESCNTMGADGMESSVVPAGSKKSCRSPYGLYDMVGNVAEWLAEKSVAGGDAAKGAEDATCYRAAARFGASSTVGFRCCAEAK